MSCSSTDTADTRRSTRGIRDFLLSLAAERGDADVSFLGNAEALIPRIEEMARVLKNLTKLNSSVHTHLYQRLCREAVAELLAVRPE